ncbi:MAG: 30S ribosomal protein S6 [Aquificaceae bacterium]
MAKRRYVTTRYYESVFVLKPTLTEEEVQRKIEEIKDTVQKKGGEILHLEDWGTRKLAYTIGNFNHGRYFTMQIKSDSPQLPNELDFYYKISDDVIRWLNFRTTEKEVSRVA